MALYQGIEVDLYSSGSALPFYEDPDGVDTRELQTRRVYVESITNATFVIKIRINKAFDMGPCDALLASLSFDGRDPCCEFPMMKQTWQNQRRGLTNWISHIAEFDEVSGKWGASALSFGSLDIQESSDARVTLAQVQELGMIKLSFDRVTLRQRPNSMPTTKVSQRRITEVSEKLMKGKAISNTISTTRSYGIDEPKIEHSYFPVPGRYGKDIIFKIFYRSRHALQTIGCIPRTPSPEAAEVIEPTPDVTESPAIKTEGSLSNTEQEIKSLRARLALLQRNTKTKLEPRSATAFANIPSRVKREHDDSEGTALPKRQRTSHRIEVVDLTDD